MSGKKLSPPWFVKTTTDGKFVAVNVRDTYALEAVDTADQARAQCRTQNAKWRKLQNAKKTKARGKK